jgi:hypothetical protein
MIIWIALILEPDSVYELVSFPSAAWALPCAGTILAARGSH